MKSLMLSIILGSLVLASQVDLELAEIIQEENLQLTQSSNPDSLKIKLGQMLFFDKILSGNKDMSCATCHHPSLNSHDELALPVGIGGSGLGEERIQKNIRRIVPRNSPDIFNRANEEWHTMFWDGRLEKTEDGKFITPLLDDLPDGLDNLLAAQAMFPVLARDEMRGFHSDLDVFGQENELALISEAMPASIWNALMKRLLDISEYEALFKKVYPNTSKKDLGFQHAANAIAAFETVAFKHNDSPWDRYMNGNSDALTDDQRDGAHLFYTKAKCGTCHSGPLMSDQKYYNLGVPQIGPGRGNASPSDVGRFAESGQGQDRYAFKTPSLRNVMHTGPYMHNGAIGSVEEAIAFHFDPTFDPYELPEYLKEYFSENVNGKMKQIYAQNKPEVLEQINLTDAQFAKILAFMEALTDESSLNLENWVIDSVPSGLEVDVQVRIGEKLSFNK